MQVPDPLWNIPFRRNPFFTGRAEVLASLHTMLHIDQSAVLVQPPAISGLGGIGKTQTAIEYAYRYRDEYRAVLWIQANSRETLIGDTIKIATLLNLPEQNERETERILHAVKRWLETNTSWLLIFDNADDLSVVSDMLPSKNSGHILFTTRATAMSGLAKRVEIEKMDAQEGMLLLLRRANILSLEAPLESAPETDLATVRAIVEAMDGLPLALDQAGAYIEETGCSLSDYLQLYQTHRAELLKERGERKDYHPDPVATTWALSFEKVQDANPATADLLRLCAFLAPDDSPEDIIIKAPGDIGTELQSLVGNPYKLNKTIKELLKYSLIRRDSSKNTIIVHRLVQAVLRDGMDEEIQQQWAKYAIRAVNESFPVVEKVEEWQRCQQWIPHAFVCAEFIGKWQISFTEAARLMNKAGYYLNARALYTQAEPLYQYALAIYEKVQGPHHPDTATSLNNLGLLYKNLGKYADAELLYQRALAIYEKVQDLHHPDMATSLNNLGLLYKIQGRYSEAEPLYQRALAIYEKVSGANHSDIVRGLNNLATLYGTQGKYMEAEPLYQRALGITERVLGANHPDTALSLNNLGMLYKTQGRYAEAEPLYQRALEIKEKVLGANHPDTAASLDNLGTLYKTQGKYAEAERLYKQALEIYETMLGANHFDTALSLNSLGMLYNAQGKYREAESLLTRSLTILEQSLGSKHPYTIMIRENYNILLQHIKPE